MKAVKIMKFSLSYVSVFLLVIMIFSACQTDIYLGIDDENAYVQELLSDEGITPTTPEGTATITREEAAKLRARGEDAEIRERNMAWSADINHLRELLLYHPLLSPNSTRRLSFSLMSDPEHVFFTDRDRFLEHYQILGSPYLSHLQDAELRIEIVLAFESLSAQVPELSDAEILLGMSEIMAMLGDTHTGIVLLNDFRRHIAIEYFYPISFQYANGNLYMWRILSEYEHLIFSQLAYVNDVPAMDVFHQINRLIPGSASSHVSWILRCRDALVYFGVLDRSEYAVEYTLIDRNGETHILTLEPIRVDENSSEWFSENSVARGGAADRGHWHTNLHPELNYWHEWLPEYSTMYMRFRHVWEMPDLLYYDFGVKLSGDIQELINNGTAVERLIIDLRGNPGGALSPRVLSLAHYIADFSTQMPIGQTYVIINSSTNSMGVWVAALLRELNPDILLVGEPAIHSPNFFAGPESSYLPNNGAVFSVSWSFWEPLPDYKHDRLMPDIFLPRTFECLYYNRDFVLEAIKLH